MKLIALVKKISKIIVNSENLYLFGDNVLYYNDLKIKVPEGFSLYEKNDEIFISDSKIKKIFKLVNDEFELLLNDFSELTYYFNKFNFSALRINHQNSSTDYFFLLDNVGNIITLDGIKILAYYKPNSFIVFNSIEKSGIIKFDLTGKELWSYTLPDGYTIRIKVEVADDVLFFKAYDSSQNNQLVIGLDLESGTTIYHNKYEVNSEGKFIQAHILNPKDNLLYGFGHIYQIFNPKSGELILEKTFKETEVQKLLPYVNAIYENKLWFVSGKGQTVKFGYINLGNHQLEFLQDFPQDNDEVFDTPVFHEGKLYLRGKLYKTLYIFE